MKIIFRVFFLLSLILCLCFSQEKTTIAVYDLRSTSILSQEEVEILTNHLRSILINLNMYDCLDRNRMDEILNEQGFQQSGCTNESCIVEAGQLLGVQKMLSGSVGKFGKLYTIELQIIDIETSKIENSSTYYYEGEMEQLLTEGIKLSLEKLIETKQKILTENQEKGETFSKSDVLKKEPKFGFINFKIIPTDASIKIDNKRVPKESLNNYKIESGTYDLQIYKRGYNKYIDVISIESGKKLVIEKTLELEEKREKTSTAYKNISIIGTSTSSGLGILSYVKSMNYYNQHKNSKTKDDLKYYKNLTIKYRNYSKYCALASGGFVIYYLINYLSDKEINDKLSVNLSSQNDDFISVTFNFGL